MSIFIDSTTFYQITNSWSLHVQISDPLIHAFVQWVLLIAAYVPGGEHSEQSYMVCDFIEFEI